MRILLFFLVLCLYLALSQAQCVMDEDSNLFSYYYRFSTTPRNKEIAITNCLYEGQRALISNIKAGLEVVLKIDNPRANITIYNFRGIKITSGKSPIRYTSTVTIGNHDIYVQYNDGTSCEFRGDVCRKITVEFINDNPCFFPSFTKITMPQLNKCLDSIPLNETIRSNTLNQFRMMLKLYAFTDLLEFDVEKELTRIQNSHYKNDFLFHYDLYLLSLNFPDKQTLYLPPYPFYKILPYNLDPQGSSNNVMANVNGYYNQLQTLQLSQIDLPNGKFVQSINGMEAEKYMTEGFPWIKGDKAMRYNSFYYYRVVFYINFCAFHPQFTFNEFDEYHFARDVVPAKLKVENIFITIKNINGVEDLYPQAPESKKRDEMMKKEEIESTNSKPKIEEQKKKIEEGGLFVKRTDEFARKNGFFPDVENFTKKVQNNKHITQQIQQDPMQNQDPENKETKKESSSDKKSKAERAVIFKSADYPIMSSDSFQVAWGYNVKYTEGASVEGCEYYPYLFITGFTDYEGDNYKQVVMNFLQYLSDGNYTRATVYFVNSYHDYSNGLESYSLARWVSNVLSNTTDSQKRSRSSSFSTQTRTFYNMRITNPIAKALFRNISDIAYDPTSGKHFDVNSVLEHPISEKRGRREEEFTPFFFPKEEAVEVPPFNTRFSIVTNSFCESSCASVVEHLVERERGKVFVFGGITGLPAVPYSEMAGNSVIWNWSPLRSLPGYTFIPGSLSFTLLESFSLTYNEKDFTARKEYHHHNDYHNNHFQHDEHEDEEYDYKKRESQKKGKYNHNYIFPNQFSGLINKYADEVMDWGEVFVTSDFGSFENVFETVIPRNNFVFPKTYQRFCTEGRSYSKDSPCY